MELNVRLEDLRKSTSVCQRCLGCAFGEWPKNYPLCPIYQRHRVFTASPGGIIYILKALVDQRVRYTTTMAEFAYQCTLCGACDVCEVIPIPPPHATVTDLIRFLRHQLVKEGMVPEGIGEVRNKIQKDGDWKGKKVDIKVPESIKNENAETILFVEGIHSKSESGIYQSAINLLEKMATPVTIFSHDEGSCGGELYDLGFWDELNKLLKKTVKEMEHLGGKEVIFINPHTQEFILKRYPEVVSKRIQIRGRHLSELLLDAFKEGKLRAKKQKVKVSYHDPCHLSRGLGIKKAPREILSFLGVDLIEMKRNSENTYCCGSGGASQAFLAFSNWVTSERIKEFKETGAELLITACPYCKEKFQRVLPTEQRNRVKDLVEFVDEKTEY